MPRYLITSELGPRRKMTPEGFLVCVDVPIARTGDYEYNVDEGQSPGIQPGDDGKIISKREPAEVFAPAALASFEGKPVTIGHPTEDVTPANWKQYAVGTVSNVRRGSGDDADKVIADLIISDRSAIEAINQGLRELSCGYDVTLQQKERGVEVQTMIRGNHVALVDAGRAGPSCAIRDHKGGSKRMDEKKEGFSWEQVKELVGMLGGLFKGGAPAVTDAEPVKGTEPAAPATEPAEGDKKADDELEALKARIAELEAERDALKAELEADTETALIDEDETIVETGDENKTDARPLGFANRVEILAPGMRFDAPAKTDAKADARKKKLDIMRRALDRACDDAGKRAVIVAVTGKVDSWAEVKDSRVAMAFKTASAALATINDAKIPAPVTHGDSVVTDKDYAAKVRDRYVAFAKSAKK